MRLKGRSSVVVVYVLIVLISAVGFRRIQSVQDENHRQFCTISLQRWKVQHDVISKITTPIPLPTGDAAAIARTQTRNEQLAQEGSDLLAELGPAPKKSC